MREALLREIADYCRDARPEWLRGRRLCSAAHSSSPGIACRQLPNDQELVPPNRTYAALTRRHIRLAG